MGRGNASVKRQKTNTRAVGKIIIYCEGRRTEPEYINLFKQQRRCTLEPIANKGTGISKCMDFVEESDKKYNMIPNSKKKDIVGKWLMFDCDGREDVIEAIKVAKEKGFKIAFSNMCIEYWFVLHVIKHDGSAIPMKGESHSKAQIEMINRGIDSYNKTADIKIEHYDPKSKGITEEFFEYLLSADRTTKRRRIDMAFEQAMRMHKEKKVNGCEYAESVTTIYELLLELGVFTKMREYNGHIVEEIVKKNKVVGMFYKDYKGENVEIAENDYDKIKDIYTFG